MSKKEQTKEKEMKPTTLDDVLALAPTNEELEQYISEEEMQSEEARDKAMQEKGMLPYLALESGKITRFKILKQIPQKRISSYDKLQYVIKVMHKDELKDWTVTVNSPFAGYVREKLSLAPIDVAVLRSGKGTETRYEFIEEEEET